MKNIKLKLEYDGANYCGWQKQKNEKFITLQGTLEKAISNITKEKIEVIGASRTDSGVHARGYICNFFTNTKIPPENLQKVINNILPPDIVVLSSEEASSEFHSRFCSKGKTYEYTVLNSSKPIAIGRNYIFQFKDKLNIDNMKMASRYFIGTHDFSAFKTKGSSIKTSVRTISKFEINKKGDFIKFIITGDGFLYNMVRIIVGTLIEIGLNKREPEYIKYVIKSKDRTKAGKCVPSSGLCLKEVFY
ncbi:tRNA pseudouridine(38-40) synthase TruA [Clostridium botulinum]|uniref:tRNA pseudouridine synthase A n=1 Tax=Clostridium botulinum (strain Hall / ATCC 3502 / NCTC 13319 / Type A) TaxID=441771 RepID=A5I7H2_CLOBH|nr:tRNA pseudouridine(38-40) synthase TruA [Clostridium botulinum]ABS33081.1 tRNA pseudouridine synthase A [Clostridium botulinum A str. ATCC 19397]ABS35884.1 tRNA pseudouridine synthase A [Clostridium botulinum A str. Hall]AWB19251.1 tRNA pseudouridine(38-40) synthase TruA [Clostridium botulinum]AWB32071.1 tRNA pseudouridine(38-40) synthase TruA [Clostridium botulinum]EGT5615544.1 tRNA pseudouridine(38-40) synthase TruA [Clostridium botulinum]